MQIVTNYSRYAAKTELDDIGIKYRQRHFFKHDLVKEMAHIFDISPHALTVPDIDTYIGLMHTLFALEDMYGLKIGEIDGEICLRLDKSDYSTYTSMLKMFQAWQQQAAKLENGEISKEQYDEWRYKYPELDTYQHWAKVPSQAVSDMLMEELVKIRKRRKENIEKEKTEISIKRPCRYSVFISENQQGFLYTIDVIIQCVML